MVEEEITDIIEAEVQEIEIETEKGEDQAERTNIRNQKVADEKIIEFENFR